MSFFTSSTFAKVPQVVPIPEDKSLSPQIEFAGFGIATLTQGKNREHKDESGINVSDSTFLFGASQRLYDQAIGSFGFGMLTSESNNTSSSNPSFIHQSFVDYQSEKYEVLIGRSDNQSSHIIDFPTIREEDLITIVNPLNPFSNGNNTEEHRFANVAAFSVNQNLAYFENFHVQHLINSADPNKHTGVNSYGVTFQFLSPPGLESLQRIPSWGIGIEHLSVDDNSSAGLTQFYGGAVVNLNESVTQKWDLRFQGILSSGSELSAFSNMTNSFQADSENLAVALRYLNAAFGGAGYQLSLTGGYKNYRKIQDAKTTGVALTGVKQLGGGFDAVAQYQGQWREKALASVQSAGLEYEYIFELGLSFNFDATLNQHISPRRTLLNQQHQYIPN